ncbi:MAG: L,D-transpeptidase family protein [Desulfatirhabdiaceae bacterium]
MKFIFSILTTFGIIFAFPGTVFVQQQAADRVVIEKADRKLTLYRKNHILWTYKIALGGDPVGKKQCEGDNRTPEGLYTISGRNPNSRYHRSLRISYPNPKDIRQAKRLRCNPGGDITIHGRPNGYPEIVQNLLNMQDLTLGCVAVTDPEIEEIWELVPNGTPVEIKP